MRRLFFILSGGQWKQPGDDRIGMGQLFLALLPARQLFGGSHQAAISRRSILAEGMHMGIWGGHSQLSLYQ